MLNRILFPSIVAILAYGLWLSSSVKDIAAGVALFLFGMLCMEQGFKAFSGGILQQLLSTSTDRLWKSLTFGLVSTSLMQSSSLVSVITISFLSAEMISLTQGIGIIFGANLGTTTGAWLVAGFGLKVKISAYATPILVFGVLFLMQSSARLKGLGLILVGIGFLFLGIHYMKEGFSVFANQIDLTDYAMTGILGLLVFTSIGAFATVVMQSSHATLTLIITALAASQVTYENALALAIGANIGTTITALLGSIGANIDGRRLAVAHLIFNLTTGLVALLLINPLILLVEVTSQVLGIAAYNYTLKLAVFHSLFNLIGVLIMLPGIALLVSWLEQHVRGGSKDRDQARYLSKASLDLPEVAKQAVYKETLHLFSNAFTLIAHGVNLRRSTIVSEIDLDEITDSPGELIEVDLDEMYSLTIKEIYSANIEFLSQAQAAAPPDLASYFNDLRRANMDIVMAIKAVKHLRKNLLIYSRSDNIGVRREYNRFRVRIGKVLRALGALRDESNPVVELLSLDHIRVEAMDAEHSAAANVDQLIRQGAITSNTATSLINDGAYAREAVLHLLDMMEALGRSRMPADDLLGTQMSLHIEEIAEIARRQGAVDLPEDAEEYR